MLKAKFFAYNNIMQKSNNPSSKPASTAPEVLHEHHPLDMVGEMQKPEEQNLKNEKSPEERVDFVEGEGNRQGAKNLESIEKPTNTMRSEEDENSYDYQRCQECHRRMVYRIHFQCPLCPVCIINHNLYGVINEEDGTLTMIEALTEVLPKQTHQPEQYNNEEFQANKGTLPYERLLEILDKNIYRGRDSQGWEKVQYRKGHEYIFRFDLNKSVMNKVISNPQKQYVVRVLKDLDMLAPNQLTLTVLKWMSSYLRSDLTKRRLKELTESAANLSLKPFLDQQSSRKGKGGQT